MLKPLIASALIGASAILAAPQALAQAPAQNAMQEREIYGSQLMTPEERAEYRTRMRSLATEEERERFRLEHHKLMQERASKQGLTLPDDPPFPGRGMGPAPGGRMGPGGAGRGPGR